MAYGTRTSISPDLTQNDVPDENVQISDKSQHREKDRFEGRAAPGFANSPACSHTLMALCARTAIPCHLPG